MARKILLADDSVTAQNMGRKILADAGYEVITVNNGSAALKKIAEAKPDLIVLDVYMPGYSGLEVCQRLKEVPETSRIPVLLTVGKLEPFKPEEAKRVRAEGFIVKPFEASELLSVLAKLEDKIVPRPEPSKPGRFARANAAIEEGRYDKTVAVEEDTGWKNRIAFPSKKRDKTPEPEDDDSSIYNPVNKDMRTLVDRQPARQPQQAKTDNDRLDLGALVPEGLPKDVTLEEIAALAAAAAKVQGKIAEGNIAPPPPEPPSAVTEAAKLEAAKNEVQGEAKPEARAEETRPVAEPPREVTAPAGATFAGNKPDEIIAASAETHGEAARQDSLPAAHPSHGMAAIAAFAPAAAMSGATSGNGSESHGPAEPPISIGEPVTMAVAAGAEYSRAASRWTAVPTAIAHEESAISLELEMQKAHAAFAAAEGAHAGLVALIPDIRPAAAEPVELPPRLRTQ